MMINSFHSLGNSSLFQIEIISYRSQGKLFYTILLLVTLNYIIMRHSEGTSCYLSKFRYFTLLYPRDSDLLSVDLVLSQTENMGCEYIKADFPLDMKVGMQEWWKLHSKQTVSFRALHTPNIYLPPYIT